MPERASQKYAVYIWTREYRTSTPLKRPEEASERAEAVRISTPAALGAPAAHVKNAAAMRAKATALPHPLAGFFPVTREMSLAITAKMVPMGNTNAATAALKRPSKPKIGTTADTASAAAKR